MGDLHQNWVETKPNQKPNKMNKVYLVYKEAGWEGTDQMLSVHATEEGAKKECQRLFERRNKPHNPYYWEEVEIEP
jgi:hypothetical protein